MNSSLIDKNYSQLSQLNDLVGQCPPMQQLFKRILRVATADITVLIQGESGTGKELAARALHQQSNRHSKALISVNCAAIPESLIESELFGHEKGAFTGASSARQGLIEAAEYGSLFLDEIGELPLEAQARLLRVLQENEVRRVGAVNARKVDIRLIAATHRNLKQLVTQGRFREDLYYRLQVIELNMPPLRERGLDIIAIAEHLIKKHCNRLGIDQVKSLSETARARMLSYSWPGNVRELENAVQRALILGDQPQIQAEDLSLEPAEASFVDSLAMYEPLTEAKKAQYTLDNSDSDKVSLEEYFQNFVREHQQKLSETEIAQKLGISRKCLWERRQRFNIPRPKTRK